jgi:hypothetical protein
VCVKKTHAMKIAPDISSFFGNLWQKEQKKVGMKFAL